jgi:ribonuclease HIII
LKRLRGRQVSAFIPSTLVSRIVDLLASISGFEEAPVTSRYEAIRGRLRNKIVIIYHSGSVVYDESLEEVRSMLEKALYEYYEEGGIVVGSDEAGKGEVLGPLVVAATALTPRQAAYLQSIGVADSKIIPENRVPELARRIRHGSLECSVLKIEPLKLNEMFRVKEKYGNLNDILARGHRQVLKRVVSKISEKPNLIIIDKFDSSKNGVRMQLIEKALKGLRVQAVERGEVFPAVAAASILARESYLRWIRRNIGKEILEKIRKGDYASVGSKEKMESYFKMCYIKKA